MPLCIVCVRDTPRDPCVSTDSSISAPAWTGSAPGGAGSRELPEEILSQGGNRGLDCQLFRLFQDRPWHPARERNGSHTMVTPAGVLLVNRREAGFGETARETGQRRPQPAVNQRDPAVNQLADKDVPGCADGCCQPVYLMRRGMPPPASPDALSGDRFREVGDGAPRRHENDAMSSNKLECLPGGHCFTCLADCWMRAFSTDRSISESLLMYRQDFAFVCFPSLRSSEL